jgi:hypothetical protein
MLEGQVIGLYILDGHEPKPCEDYELWLAWRVDHPDHHVALDNVGDKIVSTIFVGVSVSVLGPPLLFETMVFGKDGAALEQERCATWDEAVAQHARIVATWTERGR